MLLNRITLAPGEAIYLPAGNLHNYLHGVGVEVMANSDNVLRGGLTPKHVDVPELLRVLDFTPASEDLIRPKITKDGFESVYDTPAPEFAVSELRIDGEHARSRDRRARAGMTGLRSCCAPRARRWCMPRGATC